LPSLDLDLINKIKQSDIYENLKHAKNYFSADIATKAIGFISIPIFTRLLTPEDYGIVSVYNAYIGIMVVILSLNSFSAVNRYCYEKKEDFNEFLGTSFIFIGLIFSILTFIFLLFYDKLSLLINLPKSLLIYLILMSLFNIVYSIYLQILYPQKKSKLIARISIIYGYSGFVLAAILTFILQENRYLGKIWASLVIGFIFFIYFLLKLMKDIKFSLNLNHIRYIIFYSFPLIPYVLSEFILGQFDRIMINSITSTKSAGLYSLGYSIGMLLVIVISATQASMTPDFFKFLDNREFERLNSLIKKIFSIIILVALGIILFGQELLLLIADPRYYSSVSVIPIITIGYIFYGIFVFYGMYIGYTKRTLYLSLTVLAAGIINIILNYILIPKYDYLAAAYTTMISYFIMFLFTWLVVKYVLKQIVPSLKIFLKPAFVMFVIVLLVFLISFIDPNFILMFFIKLSFFLIFSYYLFHKEIKIIYSGIV
jgi:O-antigen/teichoic acid export membrane protein